jgi:hypothetical protein
MQSVRKQTGAHRCSLHNSVSCPARDLSAIRLFLEGNAVEITSENFTALSRLCEEFGFRELRGKFAEFRPAQGNADARGRIAALENKAERHDGAIAVLQDRFTRLATDFWRLAGEAPHCGLLQRECIRSPVRFPL